MTASIQGPGSLPQDCHPVAIALLGRLRSRGRDGEGTTIGLCLVASEVYPELMCLWAEEAEREVRGWVSEQPYF